MTTTTALTIRPDQTPTTTDILADFGKFLRLPTADGDASPATIRSYHSNAGQFVAWCAERGINPATATEDDIAVYRRGLVAQYKWGLWPSSWLLSADCTRLPSGAGCVKTTLLLA